MTAMPRFPQGTPLGPGAEPIVYETVLVTPEMAKEWLALNTHNRTIRKDVVAKYAQDMLAGRWQYSGQPVLFSRAGVLLDGQHRLAAVVEAGISVLMVVGRGTAEEAFETIDIGRVRPASDTLGIRGELHKTTLSAALANLWRYLERKMFSNAPISTPTLLDLLRRAPGIRESVAFTCSARWHNLAAPGVIAFCHYLFQQKHPEKAAVFFQQLRTGEELVKGNPALALRERLFEDRRGQLEKNEVIALFFRAWNAYVQGQELRRLRLPTNGKGRLVIPDLV